MRTATVTASPTRNVAAEIHVRAILNAAPSTSTDSRYAPKAAIAVELTADSKLRADKHAPGISITATPQHSCPDSCALKGGNGCYAESGPMAYTTRRLNAAPFVSPEETARAEAAEIRKLSGRYPLRLKTVGDSKTDEAAATVAEASAEYSGWRGQPVWTYTHAWREVERGSWGNVSVLASCETDQDVIDATERGYAVAKVWDDRAEPVLPPTVGGLKAWQCPQTTGARPDCARCLACTHDRQLFQAGTAVIFPLHGSRRNAAAAAVAARQ